MSLGVWLREERRRRDLSYRKLEALTGISHSTLEEIEKNPDYDPGLRTVIKLADGMGVPRWKMLDNAGYPSGTEQSPPLTPDELDRAIEVAIDQMNEDARGPVRDAKRLLANLLWRARRNNAH